jgi:methyltransferase-like protein 6
LYKCLIFLKIFVYVRNWIQATFILNPAGPVSPNNQHDQHNCEEKEDTPAVDTSQKKTDSEEIDLSVDFTNMFVTSHYLDEVTSLVFLITHLKLEIYDKMCPYEVVILGSKIVY